MIARAAGALLDRAAAGRRRTLERLGRRAAEVQAATLLRLLSRARRTEFGRAHDFAGIRSAADYQARVPLRSYPDFVPLWERAIRGEPDVTWPGRQRRWAKTSGTTAGEKYIPVTAEALASHRRGGWDALLLAAERVGGAHLLGGPMLFLGGSTALEALGAGSVAGDLSGLVMRRLPPGIGRRYSPGAGIAAIPDWEERLARTALRARGQDLRLLCGMPSWLLILFERIGRAAQLAGHPLRDLRQCWPNLRVLVHGGVSFAPYGRVFEEWMGGALDRVEVYPASEGFVAIQTEPTGGLTLMIDYGIFYEFVPVEDVGQGRPRRCTVAEVEIGRTYAIALTTPAGLWSYLLGDTVRVTAEDPLRLEITGRTRHFVNAFGENVIVEEVERAVVAACRLTQAQITEFTVAPRYPSSKDARGGHDWLVEFRVPPRAPEAFVGAVDRTLMELNQDYRTKRRGGVGMRPPRLLALPAGSFYAWQRSAGKLGDQHKVARVTNDRTLADALLATAGLRAGEPGVLLGA